MAAASSAVLPCPWLGHPAVLPSSILQLDAITLSFPRFQNAVKSIQIEKSSPTGHLAILLLLISSLWPQLSPPAAMWESCICIWEPCICIWNATADQPMAQVSPAELGTATSFAVSVPWICLGRCWLRALSGLAKGVIFLVDLLALLTINCTSAGHMFHRVVCKADSPSEMLSAANGAWNICFSLPSVAGSTPWCKEFIISWYEAQTQMYCL